MKALLEQHPLPWTRSKSPEFSSYFVQDANRKIVATVTAYDETSTDLVDDEGRRTMTVVKTLRPGADRFADAIVALPELMAAIMDAHAAIVTAGGEGTDLEGRLEKLIERVA